MLQEFIIKPKPLQKIVLHETGFDIINKQYKDENGFFLYVKVYDIGFQEKTTNYGFKVFNFLMSILFDLLEISNPKEKEYIRMNYDGKETKFPLFDYDTPIVNEAILAIKSRLNDNAAAG